MNAIILAAGQGSRMYQSGYSTPKPLLPIMGVPNIERTILFLIDFGITDITILIQTKHLSLYKYLSEKYNCSIVDAPMCYNTLYNMNFIKNKIDDTFVIEGDVVLIKNVFVKKDSSFYYVTRYLECEHDAWHPIIREGKIIDFEIGKFDTPCIFGISFWAHKNACVLQKKLTEYFVPKNFESRSLFWDDCVTEILQELELSVFEISNIAAYEINNGREYDMAQELCKKYYSNCEKFLQDSIILSNSKKLGEEFVFVKDDEICRKWQIELLNQCHTNDKQDIYMDIPQPVVFNKGEYPLMLCSKSRNEYIAYIDVAESSNYILLRRLLVKKNHRNKRFGTKIIKKLMLYAKLTNKELRVNVYDESVEPFYLSLGMKLYFKTYRI